jgi:transposase
MLSLDVVRVTYVREADREVTIEAETTAAQAWIQRCGCRAESQDRMWEDVGDLECFGRPTRLRIWKRRWRCCDLLCSAWKWTEPLEFLDAQVVLTRRIGAEACRRVGVLARSVSQVAEKFGVCWETVMNAVDAQGLRLSTTRIESEPFANSGLVRRCSCGRTVTITRFTQPGWSTFNAVG